MAEAYHIKGGRIVDPARGRDEIADLFIADGHIVDKPASGSRVIDAHGLVIAPGFIDLHVHLREPGGEENETIETGSRAAARGGFTTIVAMPNTKPAHDTPETIAYVKKRGDEVGVVEVLPCGAITKERKGKELAPLAELKKAGAVAFTDDGSTVQDDAMMERAMRAALELDLVIMDHAQDNVIERQGGVMHDGEYSKKFGLPGIPSYAEEKIIRRDIMLAEKTGCRLHIQHVTSREGVQLIRAARARGVRVTGELTPHHLVLCDGDVHPDNPNYKMNPPLRSADDRAALVQAICDGTLSCFATDHAPHHAEKKARGFLKAPFGVVGLETAIGVTYSALVANGRMTLSAWIQKWTAEPAAIIGRPAPTLSPGAPANLVIMDLSTKWTVDVMQMATKSKNTPFIGWELTGRPKPSFYRGKPIPPSSHEST